MNTHFIHIAFFSTLILFLLGHQAQGQTVVLTPLVPVEQAGEYKPRLQRMAELLAAGETDEFYRERWELRSEIEANRSMRSIEAGGLPHSVVTQRQDIIANDWVAYYTVIAPFMANQISYQSGASDLAKKKWAVAIRAAHCVYNKRVGAEVLGVNEKDYWPVYISWTQKLIEDLSKEIPHLSALSSQLRAEVNRTHELLINSKDINGDEGFELRRVYWRAVNRCGAVIGKLDHCNKSLPDMQVRLAYYLVRAHEDNPQKVQSALMRACKTKEECSAVLQRAIGYNDKTRKYFAGLPKPPAPPKPAAKEASKKNVEPAKKSAKK